MLAIAAAVVLVVGIRLWRADRGRTWNDGPMVAGVAAAALVIIVAFTAWGFYPYKAEYHQWATTSGAVTDINSRLIGTDGSGLTERFVVTLDGVGDRACDDTRCASVKVGDVLTLSCKREWQFSGTDGYGCNFVELKKS